MTMPDDFQLEDEMRMPQKDGLRQNYFDFLKEFRDYLAEYIRESVIELSIAELTINRPIKIFDGFTQGKARIKNQGGISCYLSTTGQGGYRLDPGESIEFWVNHQVIATTVSGSTVIGFIRA